MNRIKKILPLLLLLLFGIVSGCSAQKKSSKKQKAKSETKTVVKKVTVSGNVTQTNAYCGGARPSDEMLAELAIPRSFPNKKFHVIKGETNTASREILLSFTSDSVGNFSFQIVPGTYAIIVDVQAQAPDSKKYTSQYVKMDSTCFKDWWSKPYYLLEVGNANIKGLNFQFNHRCFVQYDIPCLRYDGPLPP